MSNIRIRTTPNGNDKFLNVKLDQKFDFIEILSLKISQEEVYRKFCSDYGVVVGRVTVNNGFGVPNAKVSIFIPIEDIDKEDSEIFGLYPYEQVQDKNFDALRYNLLPKKNETNNDCFTPIGSFLNKREVQDNDDALYVYCKYYKFTTTTNNAGDFMLFGVPVGTYQLHVDVDISNIGLLSQHPYDSIREGANDKLFQSTAKFKQSENLNTLSQLKTRTPISVNVQPFWGDTEQCQVGITRNDIDLATNVTPTAIFMGSIMGDNEKNSINKQCRPRVDMGKMSDMLTSSGRIEMIRKTPDSSTERYDVEGGEVIDENGTWAYQVPMNLDYVATDEYGNLVPTDDPNRGLPTRARVRFRVGLGFGGEGNKQLRAKYLIPHNPETYSDSDYSFDETTSDSHFVDLYWNKIYTVANHITRVQKQLASSTSRNFIGIKDVDEGTVNPFPFNRITDKGSAFGQIFLILCVILSIFSGILLVINKIIGVLSSIIEFVGGNALGYATISCEEENYCIGCNQDNPSYDATTPPNPIVDSTGSIYLNCVTTTLADGLGFIKFDFYNDWVNGSLYSFLFKYRVRKKGSGKEKFCDYDCEDDINGVDNDGDGASDNNCNKYEIIDTCTGAYPQLDGISVNSEMAYSNQSILVTGGLIKKHNESGEFYYAAVTKETNDKLFATKIINLGSILDCDWQGVPKFYKYLVDTTYNLPIRSPEYHDDGPFDGQISESGWDQGGASTPALIAKITCAGVRTYSNNCNNIRRLCELGMGTDEDRRDSLNGTGTPVDAKITNNDVENPWVRGVFTYLNYDTSLTAIPLVKIDATGNDYGYGDLFYKHFRGYDDTAITNSVIWTFKNSYYFYFGLIPGKSALQKMLTKYFPPCERFVENEMSVVIDNVVNDSITTPGSGQIEFHVEGGVGPYTYEWFGPTYNGTQFTCPSADGNLSQSDCGDPYGDDFTLENLLGGQYTVIVTDSSGLQSIATVTVDGLTGVQCEINPEPISNNNGKINININGGVAPYEITIEGVTNSAYNVQLTTTSLNYCYGNCTGPTDIPSGVNQLPAGEYIVTIADSGIQANIGGELTTITSQCSEVILISEPIDINLTVIPIDALCNNGLGGGQLTIDGGIAPFDIEWKLVSSNNVSNQTLVNTVISNSIEPSNLPSGNYIVTVTDLGGNDETIATVINEPAYTVVTIPSVKAPGCYYSDSGQVRVNVVGDNPPYSIDIDGATYASATLNQNGYVDFNNLLGNIEPYNVIVTDSNDCVINTGVIVPYPQYGPLYVRTTSKTWYTSDNEPVSRVIVRFKGGHGGPYHFRFPNGNWINLGNVYNNNNLPISSSQAIQPDFQVYQSTTIVNNETTYEFQFWVESAPGNATIYPFSFEYYLSDNGQQNNYALSRINVDVLNNGTAGPTMYDSNYGTVAPYGCYSYRNNGGTQVTGSSPQGTLVTQP